MPDIPNNLYRASEPLETTVEENRLLTPPEPFERQVCHITLRYKYPFRYLPGQSVGVIPGTDPKTGALRKLRLFSVASPRRGDLSDNHTVSLCVVRHFWNNADTGEKHIPGVASNYVCDLKKGDSVKITGPVGRHFLIPDNYQKRDFIFVATGTGIAPYRGMLQDLFESGYTGQARLLFGVQKRERLLYDAEFQKHTQHSNFQYLPALSREETNPFSGDMPTRENRMYVHIKMFQEAEALKKTLLKPDTLMFICGLKGMEKGVLEVLDKWGCELGIQDSWAAQLKAKKQLLMEVY